MREGQKQKSLDAAVLTLESPCPSVHHGLGHLGRTHNDLPIF